VCQALGLGIGGYGHIKWRGWRGSNPRPSASEADTLSTELQPQTPTGRIKIKTAVYQWWPAFDSSADIIEWIFFL
jgi:hypothetical protein